MFFKSIAEVTETSNAAAEELLFLFLLFIIIFIYSWYNVVKN